LDETDKNFFLIDFISKELNIEPFKVYSDNIDADVSIEHKVYPTVTSWIKAFDDAEYVVTDSFHGCVFSILFNKPFYVYGNKERGMARFDSLLHMFNLENRLVFDINELSKEKIVEVINWNKVNAILNKYRLESTRFLSDSLKEGTV